MVEKTAPATKPTMPNRAARPSPSCHVAEAAPVSLSPVNAAAGRAAQPAPQTTAFRSAARIRRIVLSPDIAHLRLPSFCCVLYDAKYGGAPPVATGLTASRHMILAGYALA